ncbi:MULTISPECIES: efflux RND transporter permease subunit [Pantoea]|uniref:efflux RND transporter permease subunit n=1 Tax=Pantoea TaxID=53335 RepID=UPI0002F2479C|nr:MULTISPECIES: efflux RND transporter permease subunit [Pantoea]MCV3300616.1 efflux RND transporter permease subunit [Pantoea ananatis]MDI3416544.1 efflux RND transporter permease subunit [Pantoea sp. V106_11]MDN4125931.1 efflux RND transporter permease subunit [Pantoea ananatis]MDN4150305.1 efflux RND transporter permease subunit [Pantoea ananatis]PQK86636.1 multidrug efflux RND transporter permease subunit [Pantoea ananatis]
MLAQFFIRRPVFAWVIALCIMLFGILSIRSLPVAQYPDVAPPQISVQATYTGASAETLESSVTQVIEQQLTGLDGLLYFSSTSTASTGQVKINVTFKQGTDPDIAQVQVQNKVQQAESRLPSAVTSQGVTVQKAQSDFLLILAVYDKSNKSSSSDVADYMVSNMEDTLARVTGVGNVQVFGAEYAMRIWLDPSKLASYSLMPSDVTTALESQNTQVSSGQLGAQPSSNTQQLVATVRSRSRLQTPEQFRNIVLKSQADGSVVRLSDVARVEMGDEDYSANVMANGHPASGMAIQLASGANALSTAEKVKSTIDEFRSSMPAGYEIAYPLDSTDFVKISIEEVVKTLVEAVILVVIVMFVFLQNIRTTLIPTIAVPVVLLGTFGVLSFFGYSINTLTMFGMVLAIGLLVDDAIVVVENVERVMREEGLPPREATEKSMREITGALVGIALVLSAVFLPMTFFSGSTGVIYRQFSITIVSSMVLSVIVALTLTPALCATLLKPHNHDSGRNGFFGWFNQRYENVQARYQRGVGKVMHRSVRYLLLYGVLLIGCAVLYMRLPTGFLPTEDQGYIMVQYQLAPGATENRTREVRRQVQQYFATQEKDNVNVSMLVDGFSFAGNGQNAGVGFISLKNWRDRKGSENSADAIAGRAMAALSRIRDAQIFVLSPPAVSGLGQSNGFTFELQARGATARDQLLKMRDQLIAKANQDTDLSAVRANSLPDLPQLDVSIDDAKAQSLGLTISDINNTLSAAIGGSYVNDFSDRGRVKKVYMQGDQSFRSKPEDIDQWYVRGTDSSNNTTMVPFSSFASSKWSYGPDVLSRYNGLASYEIQGSAAEGKSSGDAITAMEKLAATLPAGTTFAWSGLSYQEKLSGNQALSLYGISLIVVFLCLAALYESWAVPLSVMLVVPLGVIGSLLAITLRGLENDVYFQVALLTIIGLSSKNAILIVEFAEEHYRKGESLINAAVHAATMRLRPIIMTSLAFTAGVLPLAISTGAGANSRIAIGTGIIGGTLTATLLAIFFVPLFFVLVRRVFPAQPHDTARPTDSAAKVKE